MFVLIFRLLKHEIQQKKSIIAPQHHYWSKNASVPLIGEDLILERHLKEKRIKPVVAVVCIFLHSLCGTVGQRAGDPAGPAWAEPPACTGEPSRGRWSPCCRTHTQAPTTAAGSNLWTSQSTFRCPCSTRPTAMVPLFTSLTTAATMPPWPHNIPAIKKRKKLRRCSSLFKWLL